MGENLPEPLLILCDPEGFFVTLFDHTVVISTFLRSEFFSLYFNKTGFKIVLDAAFKLNAQH